MRVYLVRHGLAEGRDSFAETGQSDEFRPLTSEGEEILGRVIKGLSLMVPQACQILCSPYTRAKQTADALTKHYSVNIRETNSVVPTGSPNDLIRDLQEFCEGDCKDVFVVGHEPNLSRFVSWLVLGTPAEMVFFKQAGVCCLNFPQIIDRGLGNLEWFLGPDELVKIGEG